MRPIAPQIAQRVCFGKAYAGVRFEKIGGGFSVFGWRLRILKSGSRIQTQISRARPRGDFFYPGVI